VTYPGGAGNPITEWLIDGVWTDLSDRPRADGGIQITHGRQNEQGRLSPATANCVMDNRDYALSNRHPSSANYGLVPMGTQVRHRAGDGDNHLYIRYTVPTVDDFSYAKTADKAALDITGDLEVRADIWPHTWRPANIPMIIAAKAYNAAGYWSWALYMTERGLLRLGWSEDGNPANRITATATVAVPATSARLSIKATLDVNNGAAGNTVTFYTASSIGGTYTQLGAAVITASTTSIFSGAGALVAGGGENPTSIFSGTAGFGGRFYGLRVYNGIAGTLVADPDFTTWTIDQTSKADGTSNTWTLSGQARISSPRLRFWGELAAAPLRADKTGTDVVVEASASGIIERYSDGDTVVQSPLYLNISPRTGLLGYWALEDAEGATKAASDLTGGKPGLASGVTFGQDSDLPGAARVAELTTATAKLTLTMGVGTGTGVWYAVWLFKSSTLPTASSSFIVFTTTGLAKTVVISTSTTQWGISFYDATGTSLYGTTFTHGSGVTVADSWMAMRLKISTTGGNILWELAWYEAGSTTFWGTSDTFAGTSVGRPVTWTPKASSATEFTGMLLSHFVCAEVDLGFASSDLEWSTAINAYAGETAARRVERITGTAGIYCEITGNPSLSQPMGAQPIDTPLNVLYDCQDADGGILSELRDAYGLGFRTRQDLERRLDATLSCSSAELAEVPQATDDNQGVTNDVVINRRGGSSARATITTGALSIQDPPDGVRRKPSSGEVNCYTDDELPDIANLVARVGSFDQPRIPDLTVGLHRPQTLPSTAAGLAVAYLGLGDTVAVEDWPAWMTPDRLLFLVQGYRESLDKFLWTWKANTTPAGALTMGQYGVSDQAGGPQAWGSTSTLSADITTTATTIILAGSARVTTVDVWTTVSARYPRDIVIGAEVITLTAAPGGSTSPQTFTGCTRSVNGVVAAHLATAPVRLASRMFYGLEAG
jgi:hypothetical protein